MVFERFILAPFVIRKDKLGLFPASLSFLSKRRQMILLLRFRAVMRNGNSAFTLQNGH